MLTTTLEEYLDEKLLKLSEDVRNKMLEQVGNPDAYLRDKLIYSSFVKLIYSEQLTAMEIQELLEQLIQDEYLLFHLGDSETDTVFTRSFSVLVIAAIIEYDVENRQLESEVIRRTADNVIQYMMEEKDVRGFIENKGWAHAIAHGADALDALAKHPDIKGDAILQILGAVQHALFNKVDYLDDEEERLAVIIVSLVKCKSEEHDLLGWIEEIVGRVEDELALERGSIEAFHLQRTVKNFLKSVYVMLNSVDIGEAENAKVFEVLKKWMYLE